MAGNKKSKTITVDDDLQIDPAEIGEAAEEALKKKRGKEPDLTDPAEYQREQETAATETRTKIRKRVIEVPLFGEKTRIPLDDEAEATDDLARFAQIASVFQFSEADLETNIPRYLEEAEKAYPDSAKIAGYAAEIRKALEEKRARKRAKEAAQAEPARAEEDKGKGEDKGKKEAPPAEPAKPEEPSTEKIRADIARHPVLKVLFSGESQSAIIKQLRALGFDVKKLPELRSKVRKAVEEVTETKPSFKTNQTLEITSLISAGVRSSEQLEKLVRKISEALPRLPEGTEDEAIAQEEAREKEAESRARQEAAKAAAKEPPPAAEPPAPEPAPVAPAPEPAAPAPESAKPAAIPDLELPETSTTKPEAAPAEKEALKGLREYLNRLTEGVKDLEDLRKKLNAIFDILEKDLSKLDEYDREYLEDIQEAMKSILLDELSRAAGERTAPTNFTQLRQLLRQALRRREEKRATETSLRKFGSSEELTEIIGQFNRLYDKVGVKTPEEAAPEETVYEVTDEDIKPGPAEPEAAPAEPEAEETAETVRLPDSLAVIIDEVAAGDEVKKKRLLELWKIYQGKARFENAENTQAVKDCMRRALEFSRSPRPSAAKTDLLEALKFDDEIIPIGKTEPETPPGTPPVTPSPLSGGAAASATPEAADSIPFAPPAGAEATAEPMSDILPEPPEAPPRASRESFPNVEARASSIQAFMGRMGFPASDNRPAVMAVRTVVGDHLTDSTDLQQLEAYLEAGKVLKEAERMARGTDKTKLRKKYYELAGQIANINQQITGIQYQFRRLGRNIENAEALGARIAQLEEQKSELIDQQAVLKEALAIQQHLADEESYSYKEEPERMLALVNMYFAKRILKLKNGEKPKFAQIMEKVQEQIETAQSADAGKWYWIANRLFLHNYLKPTLTTTLTAICAKDPALKKIDAESAGKLAKCWDNQESLEGWIQGLEGSLDHNMKVVVPKLAAHLANVTKVGKMANINSFSLNRARWLLNKLRREMHLYSIRKVEKSPLTKTPEKMEAYFKHFNEMSENAVAQERIAVETSREYLWRNAKKLGLATFIGGGIGLGTASILSLSGATLGIVAATGGAGALKASSMRIKSPGMKKFISRLSARTLVGGSLGSLALAASSPWIAAPLGIAALTGCFTPEIARHRKELWRNSKKYGPGAAYVTYRGTKAAIGLFFLPLNVFKFWRRWMYT